MIEPQFSVGDRVVVDWRDAPHHCRTPYYLRGKTGLVEALQGQYRDPEKLAYHQPGLPMKYLYRVRFDQAHVWGDYDGAAGDLLLADIFEHWLTAAGRKG